MNPSINDRASSAYLTAVCNISITTMLSYQTDQYMDIYSISSVMSPFVFPFLNLNHTIALRFYFLLNTDISNKKILKSLKRSCVGWFFYAYMCTVTIIQATLSDLMCFIYTDNTTKSK